MRTPFTPSGSRGLIEDRYDPWSQQPSETNRSFALFSQYRDTSPFERSHVKLARNFGLKVDTVHQLAMRNSWTARVAAWDAENDRIKRATQVKELEGAARRQVLAGQLLMSKGLKRVQTMSDDEVAHLSVWEAVRLIEAGVRLERMGRGEPGDLNAPSYVGTQQNLYITAGETPIMELLRRNPNMVQGIIPILANLQSQLPALVSGDPAANDTELLDLLSEPEDPDA